jgi:hypothetical protein
MEALVNVETRRFSVPYTLISVVVRGVRKFGCVCADCGVVADPKWYAAGSAAAWALSHAGTEPDPMVPVCQAVGE